MWNLYKRKYNSTKTRVSERKRKMITDVRKRNGKKELQKSFRNKQIKKNSYKFEKRSPNKSRLYAKGGGGVCVRLCTLLIFFSNQFLFGICTAQAQRKNPDVKLTESHVFLALPPTRRRTLKLFFSLSVCWGVSQNTPAD